MTDMNLVLACLDALSAILKVGNKHSKNYVCLVDECDGISAIEGCQNADDDNVYKKAVQIIEKYFGAEDGEEGETDGALAVAPGVNVQGHFDFGFKAAATTATAGKGAPTAFGHFGQNANPNVNAFGVQMFNF